jgi:two-component system sensor histidine kinase YesM
MINNNRVIPYVRRITDVSNNETIGFIVININESFIRSAYLNSFPSSTASLMIVNDNGVILSHTERKYTGDIASDAYEIDEEYLKEPYFEHSLQGKNMLIISSESEKESWTYYSIVLMSDVNAGSAVIYRITLALVGAVILFIVFLSYFLSKRVTNPLRELSSVMKKAETGNLDVSYSGNNYDEIGKLGDSFNKMTTKLKKSMQETISVQKEKMEAELKGLEFQINPHFLYNTLSSIIWLADEGRNDEVIKVTKSLASFFRISISRGREMIRVREEVEHVINYMEIQKTRYGDVMFMHDVDMEIRGFYTLKLLLQPIIENAIYHGIKAIKGRGIIKLRGKREGDDLVFLISDNGNKMNKQRAEELNKALSGIGDTDLGVGLKNVNNRIKLHFGQHYGLKFGVMDGYTVVEIRIPVIESEEEDDV